MDQLARRLARTIISRNTVRTPRFCSTLLSSPNSNSTKLVNLNTEKKKKMKSPWCVVQVSKRTKLIFFYNGCNLFYPVTTPYRALEGNSTRCIGSSSFGWIALIKDTDAFLGQIRLLLLNPRTNQTIRLPPLQSQGMHTDEKLIMSSSPLDHKQLQVAYRNRKGDVFIWRSGNRDWSYEFCQASCFDSPQEIIFFKGVLYAISEDDCPKIFTIEHGYLHTFPVRRHEKHQEWHCSITYLVELQGELLQVVTHDKPCDKNLNSGAAYHSYARNHKFFKRCERQRRAIDEELSRIDVFRLDFKTRSWVEVESLGDNMLFVSPQFSVSLDATHFSQFGFRPNCIYYTNDCCFENYGWHEYCLEDKKTTRLGVDFSSLVPIPQVI